MNIIIKAKNVELEPQLREFIEKKIASLEKYFNLLQTDDDPAMQSKIEADVEIQRTTLHHRKGDVFQAEVLIKFNKNTLRAAVEADDIKKTVIAVHDDLQRQITTFKEKTIDKSRK